MLHAVHFLYNTMFGVHKNALCYKGTILRRELWSFSYNSFVKFVGKKKNAPCYKGTILLRNYRKMTIAWSVSYYSFVKFHGKKNTCVIKGQFYRGIIGK